MAFFGAGIGGGLLLVVRALQPRPVPLDQLVALLDRPGLPVTATSAQASDAGSALRGPQRILGRVGVGLLGALGIAERPALVEQLRVLNKPLERHAYEKLLVATAGLVVPLVTFSAVSLVADPVSPVLVLGAAALLAVGGFFYPDVPLAEQVAERRQAFRHAFSSYLDLVTILLAGGAGIETSLEGAAEAGDGWAFAEIRRALRRARFTRQTPWEAFEQLGAELGVVELSELAASVSLAGDHGARIKQSLTAKADALRAAQSAALEQAAENQTEKMIVPVAVRILGLVLFIGFGAINAISGDGVGDVRPAATQQTQQRDSGR